MTESMSRADRMLVAWIRGFIAARYGEAAAQAAISHLLKESESK